MSFQARAFTRHGGYVGTPALSETNISVGDVFIPIWPGAPAVQWTITAITPNAVPVGPVGTTDPGQFTATFSGTGAPSGYTAVDFANLRRISADPQWPAS